MWFATRSENTVCDSRIVTSEMKRLSLGLSQQCFDLNVDFLILYKASKSSSLFHVSFMLLGNFKFLVKLIPSFFETETLHSSMIDLKVVSSKFVRLGKVFSFDCIDYWKSFSFKIILFSVCNIILRYLRPRMKVYVVFSHFRMKKTIHDGLLFNYLNVICFDRLKQIVLIWN